jgi:glucosyl-3-phosphoglycerate synthase
LFDALLTRTMEYAQERVTTLHDLGDADPPVPAERATVVLPVTERDSDSAALAGMLRELGSLDLDRVVVALRSPREQVAAVDDWLAGFDLPLDVCWCGGPRVARHLADAGLDGAGGKGRDLWLGLGVALDGDPDHVVVHDTDAEGFRARSVRRLLFPLTRGHAFSKGYYARVEAPADGGRERLYGRLNRLFYEPLVAALAERHDVREYPLVAYLGAMRYALAGEFAATADLAAGLPLDRAWGLEVGILAAAFDHAGFDGTAQVDLGVHRHAHRSVEGAGGLESMSERVGERLLRAVAADGVDVDHDALRAQYRETAARFVGAYASDAAFNGFDHDVERERDQVERYAAAVVPPTGPDDRLPSWRTAPLDPATVAEAAAADLAEVVE